MKRFPALLSALPALCLASAFAFGQSDSTTEEPGAPQRSVAVELAVTGLEASNSSRIESAIEGLLGKSKDGGAPAKLVESATVDPAQGTIRVVIADEQQVRLSQIQEILKSNEVELVRDKLQIPAGSALVVSGKQAADIVRALDQANIGEVSVKQSETAGEFHVVLTQAKKPPTLGAITAALAKAGADSKVSDVIWQGRMGRSKG